MLLTIKHSSTFQKEEWGIAGMRSYKEKPKLSPSASSSQSQLFVPFSVSLPLFPQHVLMSSVLIVGSFSAVALHKCYKHFSCGQRQCGEQGQISVKKIICVHRTAARDISAQRGTNSFQISCECCQCCGKNSMWHAIHLLTSFWSWIYLLVTKAKALAWKVGLCGCSSNSISHVGIQHLTLQLCSQPAVKWILHKHFKCCKNKMWIRTISIICKQAHK